MDRKRDLEANNFIYGRKKLQKTAIFVSDSI